MGLPEWGDQQVVADFINDGDEVFGVAVEVAALLPLVDALEVRHQAVPEQPAAQQPGQGSFL